jgi:peptidylprolyl isomerase
MTKYAMALGLFAASFALYADDQPAPPAKKPPTKEELHSEAYIDKLSTTYGHLIQKSLNNPMVKLNPKAVMQGIQDGIDGKPSPLTEKEYEEALTLIQQFAYDDMAKKNLEEAEALLKKHGAEEGVVTLENGKILYKITQPGTGEVVTEETIPTINYEANYSNGQKLGSSEQSGGPIDVKLSDTIPGFAKGILGMKVGEKRRIYIHPELGFGKSGQLPNGLLIFDIEVTKVAPKPANVEETDDTDEDPEDDDDDLSELVSTDELLADDEDDDEEEDDDDDDLNDLNFNRSSDDDQNDPTKK